MEHNVALETSFVNIGNSLQDFSERPAGTCESKTGAVGAFWAKHAMMVES